MRNIDFTLLLDMMRAIRADIDELKADVKEIRVELAALRSKIIIMKGDIPNLYEIASRHDRRLGAD